MVSARHLANFWSVIFSAPLFLFASIGPKSFGERERDLNFDFFFEPAA